MLIVANRIFNYFRNLSHFYSETFLFQIIRIEEQNICQYKYIVISK